MYIGNPSPERLDTFLRGYRIAMDHAGLKDVSDPPFDDFHEWVRGKFGHRESTMGWSSMVLAATLGLDPAAIEWDGFDKNATPDQLLEATQRCFILFDEFRGAPSDAPTQDRK
jgi:hypothetical protein